MRRTTKSLFFGTLCFAIALGGAVTASAAGIGQSCGGAMGITCDKGLWCDPTPGHCGTVSPAGRCISVPDICPLIFMLVSGCDGHTYPNDCTRQTRRNAKNIDGRC
jgi:hypothetical protein